MNNIAGQHIKGYELQERIGAGGFGAVYRAYQSTIGREVAMKIILPGYANHPDFIRRFEAEAHVIARLEHPYIVPLHDYWRDPGGAYLVMRYLRGGSLHDSLQKQGALPIEETVNLIEQVTQALHIAHRNQVIHRDIKPGNILLDEDGNAYLADFGIAKDHTISQSITDPDGIIGSPDYLAPEQARSEPVTPQTDIYSLGVVLYEILEGKHPFPAQSPIERLYKHLNEPLPDLISLDDTIRDAVNEVIQKATAKNPQQRFKDVIVFAQALREAAALTNNVATTSLVELLTPREQEVLKLMIEGKSNREIADALVIEISTVKSYINQLYRKLNVRSRVQAIVKARELDLIVGKPQTQVLTSSSNLPEPENPYKGLRAFQAADAQDFFGREKLTQKLLKRLEETTENHRFLAVVGPSGSGKSSVVKAGLIPALWRGELSNSDNWYIVDMMPGDRPLDELEVALLRIADDRSLNLREQLARDANGLLRVADLILPDAKSELLLVIDQFEEVFTLVENESERLHFLQLLHEAVTRERSRVRVIVTLRADYYDRPLQYPDFGELIRNRVETILPLSAEELEHAVRQPASSVGVRFEDGLVSRIVADVHYQPGALPLLQYALTELFERRDGRTMTQTAYQAIGGTGGALANRADEIYLEQDEAGRELIRQIFLRLVTLGEGAEDTRRRVPRSELLAIAAPPLNSSVRDEPALMERGSGGEVMDEIIDLYSASRLLSLDNDPATRTPTVEVAHEAILREWERLRTWLNASREDIRQERIVAVAAEAWKTNHRDLSYLLSGARLEQVEKWGEVTELALTPLERDFIETSIVQRASHQKAEAKRQEHEKRLERRSITFLRTLVAVLTIAVLGTLVLTTVAVNNANEARNNLTTAERVRLASQGRILFDSGENLELAALLSLRSLSLGYSSEADQTLMRAYSSGFPLLEYQHLTAISPYSDFILADGIHILLGTRDNRVMMWNMQTGKVDRDFYGHTEWVTHAITTADSQRLLSSSADGTVRVWDMASGETLFVLPNHEATVNKLALTPDESTLITADNKGIVRRWDFETQTLLGEFRAHDRAITDLLVTINGQQIITSTCNIARLWDLATATELVHYRGHADCIANMTLTPDGAYLVTGSFDGTARLWEIATGEELMQYRGHTGGVVDVDVSPDGRYLVTASWDKSFRLWNINTGETQHIFRGQPEQYALSRFLPNNEQIVTGSISRMQVWNLETPAEPNLLIQPFDLAHNFDSILTRFINNDEQLMTVTTNGTLFTWDVETAQQVSVQNLETPILQDAVFINNHAQLITSTGGGMVQIWDIASGEQVGGLASEIGEVQQIAVTSDETMLATAGEDGIVRLWDIGTGNLIREFAGHDAGVQSIAFSSDGNRLISGGADAVALVWDVSSGQILHRLDGHTDIVSAVAISADDRYAVTGSWDTFVIVWNLDTGEQLHQIAGLNAGVRVVAFSPDGRLLGIAGENGATLLWNIQSQTIARQFAYNRTKAKEVAFSNNSTLIAMSDYESTYIWHTHLDEFVSIVCNQLGRDFTQEERVNFNILDDEPTCPDSVAEEVALQATWTPFPTLAPEAILPIQITPQVESSANSDNQASTVLQTQPVILNATGFPIEGSSATLTRTSAGIALTFHTRELTPGDAVTIWWIIFNRPALCTPPACGFDDVFLADEAGNLLRDENDYLILNQAQIDKAGISQLYATGNAVNADGTANFNAFLPVGDRTGQTTFGHGLLFPFTSEIHLAARTHGATSNDPTILYEQLNTEWGGCEPFHPPCSNPQFAGFLPVNP